MERALQGRGGELVGVVLDERDARGGPGEHLTREIRRDVQHAIDPAVAQVPQGGRLVGVGNGVERAGVGGDRLKHLLQFDGGDAVVLVHHADLEVLDLAAKGVAEHDQLHQGHDHRNDDQRRAAPEAAEIAFDDGPDAIHGYLRGIMNGLLLAAASCSASRN